MELDNQEPVTETSLLDDLSKAFEGEAAPAETTEQQEERLYRRDGRRFVPNDADKIADAQKVEAGTEPKDASPQPQKAWKPLWYKEEYGAWDKLAEPFRTALREQERNAAQAIEKHSVASKAWDPVNKQLEPHLNEMRAAGVEPQQYVSNLINADAYLRRDPVQALNWLCQQYLKTDVVGLADWMLQQNVQPQKADPVRQELDTLKQRLSNYEKQGESAQRASLEAQIQDWAKDKPYFSDVRELMASIAKVPMHRGASLDQLYDAAMHAHPQLRQRILEDKRKDEVTRARAAGATSPRSGPVNGQARQTKSTMSLTEEIGILLDGGTV